MMNHFLGDTATLTGRSLKHVFRSPDTIITTVITPIAMLLLFVYVLGGAITTRGFSGPYVSYLLPGILLITIASGISYTSFRLFTNLQSGFLGLFTLALTWLAVIPGLTAKTIDGASAFAYPLIFLPFISSAFVPTDTMPGPRSRDDAVPPSGALAATARIGSYDLAGPRGSDCPRIASISTPRVRSRAASTPSPATM